MLTLLCLALGLLAFAALVALTNVVDRWNRE
jgi:hypothetical protein